MTDDDDPIILGFREPPDFITRACLSYMARVMELRDFVGFFFGLVKSSAAIAQGMTPESRETFETEAAKYKISEYNFSSHRQLVNEIMLSRAVESFDLYVLTVLRRVFEVVPDILKTEEKIEISKVIELKSFDEMVFYLAERKLHELSYKPLSDLNDYIASKTGVKLFKTSAIYDTALVASEVRNLIAHNDCRVNDIFKRKIAKAKINLEISDSEKVAISDEWLRRVCYTLDGAVFDFDESVSEKFGLERSNRFASFIFRG